jgi:hypothetical protein
MPLGGRRKRGRRQVAAHALRLPAAVLIRKPGRTVRAHGSSSLVDDHVKRVLDQSFLRTGVRSGRRC